MFEVYLFLLSKGLDFKAQSFYMFQKNWLSKHMFYFLFLSNRFNVQSIFFPHFPKELVSKKLVFFERVQCSKHIFFLHFPKELIFKARFLFFSSGFNVQSTSCFPHFPKELVFKALFFSRTGSMFTAHLLSTFSKGIDFLFTVSICFDRVQCSKHIFFIYVEEFDFNRHLLSTFPKGWIFKAHPLSTSPRGFIFKAHLIATLSNGLNLHTEYESQFKGSLVSQGARIKSSQRCIK